MTCKDFSNPSSTQRQAKTDRTYNNCGKIRHFWRSCPEPKQGDKMNQDASTSNKFNPKTGKQQQNFNQNLGPQ